MGMTITKKRDRSPYARKGKTPFAYGEHYQRWAAAQARNDEDGMIQADIAFRRQFGIPMKGSERRGNR